MLQVIYLPSIILSVSRMRDDINAISCRMVALEPSTSMGAILVSIPSGLPPFLVIFSQCFYFATVFLFPSCPLLEIY